MKKFGVFVTATAVALGGVSIWIGNLEAQGGPAVHHIDVVLNQTASGFEVLAPCKDHKVDAAAQGDTIEFHFHNRGSVDTGATIGNFRAPIHFPGPDARRKPTPFETSCKPSVSVKSKDSATMPCRLRTDHVGITSSKALTYKYDIIGKDGKVLLDPEIEIEK